MNAKKEFKMYVQREINFYILELDKYAEGCNEQNVILKRINHLEELIAATEAAIFDVPSEEEILSEVKSKKLNANQTLNFCKGINFIVNYKPTL